MAVAAFAAGPGSRAEYVGGTVADFRQGTEGRLVTTRQDEFAFEAGKQVWTIPYTKINLIEYGQKVDRRYITAVLLSPLFLLAKSRKHFVTVGYFDESGVQQAMVFRVEKADVRTVLVGLEARTGRKVTYQDEEARKAGKG
jgi:hypothetical protein